MHQFAKRHSAELVQAEPQHFLKRAVARNELAFQIDIADSQVRLIENCPEERFTFTQLFMILLPNRDVLGQRQHRFSAVELHWMPCDFDIDQRSILLAMAPDSGCRSLHVLHGAQEIQECGHFLVRTQVENRHVEELFTRITVVMDRGLVHIEKSESLSMEQHQGKGSVLEQKMIRFPPAMRRVFLRIRQQTEIPQRSLRILANSLSLFNFDLLTNRKRVAFRGCKTSENKVNISHNEAFGALEI